MKRTKIKLVYKYLKDAKKSVRAHSPFILWLLSKNNNNNTGLTK